MKILSIGNSFSQDAMAYVHKIAQSVDVLLETVNLYSGGCSLLTHWSNALNNTARYIKEVNGESMGEYISIQDALISDKWDYITLQQVSHNSNDFSTYEPYLSNLAAFVKERVPSAEIIIHQTWAYQEGSNRLTMELGYQTQFHMFKDLQQAYVEAAKTIGNSRIIPCGTAFQHMITQGFNNLHRDTFHASIPYGRYILGAVWYEFFTNNSIMDTRYCPQGLTENEWSFLKETVHEFMTQYGVQ